ncbi:MULTISPECIES: efflux RND transporter periplasmic adaptor subunit [unclassified Sphingobium]|uniref:efflux RND transporter periplasmic adaptor subunit n=1 Tax=unclassified Sphingobium TaxID=2611147 RepID=UPI0022249E94|nr:MULTISPECIES: efflux RND transporter periplasmic adaptor subunit [unclassified Sphingobium]
MRGSHSAVARPEEWHGRRIAISQFPRNQRTFLIAFALHALAACSEKAPPPPPTPQVIIAKPFSRNVADWVDYAGRFEAVDAIDVRPRVSGLLQSVHFKDGQSVTRGQLLFTLDQRPFAARLAQARAGVARAQAALARTSADYKRATALIGDGFISQSLVDTRLADWEQAAAELANARAVAQAASLDLSFTRITAPASGRASYRRLAAGNLVSAEQTLLTTIMTQNPMRFVFDAPERAFLQFRRARESGAVVRIRLEDETEFNWAGQIEMLDNALDRSSGTIRGQALVQNPTGLLTPGMFGRMRWTLGAPSPALLVPEKAIIVDQTRPTVFVVGKDGLIAQRIVELGNIADGLRVIRSGLAPGEQVVIAGMQRARVGQKVVAKLGKIEPERPAPGATK